MNMVLTRNYIIEGELLRKGTSINIIEYKPSHQFYTLPSDTIDDKGNTYEKGRQYSIEDVEFKADGEIVLRIRFLTGQYTSITFENEKELKQSGFQY